MTYIELGIKLRHYEKATKFETISHLCWQNSCLYFSSKQEDFFFKVLWPFQKSWTLTMNKYIRPNFIEKFQEFCFSTHESTFRLWHVLVENKWQWRLLSSYCGLYAWYSLSTLLSISSCWLLSKTYHIYFTGPWRIHTHPVGAWQGCRNQGTVLRFEVKVAVLWSMY